MKRAIVTALLMTTIAVWALSMRQTAQVQNLPGVEFLGNGPGSFAVGEGLDFLVKRPVYSFNIEPGPTYTAANRERVWAISAFNSAPPALFDETVDLGEVPAGCVVEYIGIDDDEDGRINAFYLDGNEIHTVTQGMVFSGEFTVASAGRLTFVARDSVGAWIDACREIIEPTPEATDTPTATTSPTVTETATPTDVPTETPTVNPSITPTEPGPTETPTSTPVATETPTVTATAVTATPTATEEVKAPTVTTTPTKEPRLNSCLRINFEQGGDVARRGLYVVQEVGGRVLVEWYAEEGWTDSGWFTDIDITFPSVYVKVLYYSGPGATPIEMKIVNPAPGTPYGWLSRGMCHAIEIAWPDEPPPAAPEAAVSTEVENPVASEPTPVFVPEEEEEDGGSGTMYGSLSGR